MPSMTAYNFGDVILVPRGDPHTRRRDSRADELAGLRTEQQAVTAVLQPQVGYLEAIRAELPELPLARAQRFQQAYQLPESDAFVLTQEKALADYFEEVAKKCGNAKAAW